MRCSPLVSKRVGIILKVERTNQSGSNEVMIMEAVYKLYKEHSRKKFDLSTGMRCSRTNPNRRQPLIHLTRVQDRPKGLILVPNRQEMKVWVGVKDRGEEGYEEKAQRKGCC